MRVPMRAVVALLAVVAAAVVTVTRAEDDEDDDISGPVMPVKEDGGLYDTKQLIELQGYGGESAQVTTADGYVLRLFRVLPKAGGASLDPAARPVVICHGTLASSDAWVTDAESLAFALSDAGHDVWLCNARGNAYSRAHAALRPDADAAFWAYDYHEIATGDLPAVIDHVLNATGRDSVHYVGHSLGAAVGLVLLSSAPAYNGKVRTLSALAPAFRMSKLVEMIGPDGMVHDMVDQMVNDIKALGKSEMFPRNDIKTDGSNQITCADLDSFKDMCEEKLGEGQEVLGGGYLPAGISWRLIETYYQAATWGVIRRHNYSTAEENLKAYGAESPPGYDLGLVTAPVTFYSSEHDQLVMPSDVDDLKELLPNVVGDVRINEVECFDHVTFVMARQKSCLPERRKLYQAIVDALKKADTT